MLAESACGESPLLGANFSLDPHMAEGTGELREVSPVSVLILFLGGSTL